MAEMIADLYDAAIVIGGAVICGAILEWLWNTTHHPH